MLTIKCSDEKWEWINKLDAFAMGFGFNLEQAEVVEKKLGMESDNCFAFLGHHNTVEGIENRITCLAFALTIPEDMIP